MIYTPEIKAVLKKIYSLPFEQRKQLLPKLRQAMRGKKRKPEYLWELNE